MAKAPVALTSLSEEQRAEAYARFEILRPALEEGVSQAQIARTHQLSKSNGTDDCTDSPSSDLPQRSPPLACLWHSDRLLQRSRLRFHEQAYGAGGC